MDAFARFTDLLDGVQDIPEWAAILQPSLQPAKYERHVCDCLNVIFEKLGDESRMQHTDAPLYDAMFDGMKIEFKKAQASFVLDLAKIHTSRDMDDLIYIFISYKKTDAKKMSLHVVHPKALYQQLLGDCHPGFLEYLDQLQDHPHFSTEIKQVQHQFHYTMKQVRKVSRYTME